MGSICRLCLHKNDYDSLKNIFEFVPKYFDLNLTEILYWIFDIEIIVEDTYTKFICYKCLNVIETVGRFRKFFQTNQTFLHDRTCPKDYKVESGWYNTRDIGTNTGFSNEHNATISVNDLNISNSNSQVKSILKNCDNSQQSVSKVPHDKQQPATIVQKAKWINVPSSIFEKFTKTKTINPSTDKNQSNNRIDVPLHIFELYPFAQVKIRDLKEDCLKQSYFKVNGQYKLINDININLSKIDLDKYFLKKYRRIGRHTFKKLPQLTKADQERLQKKRLLLQNYYYRKPTSALRELITEKSNDKMTFTSLVKTNEVYVQVCKYCSKVFRLEHNLIDHYAKVHRLLMNESPIPLEESLHIDIDPLTTEITTTDNNEIELVIRPSSINPLKSTDCVEVIKTEGNEVNINSTTMIGINNLHNLNDNLEKISSKENKHENGLCDLKTCVSFSEHTSENADEDTEAWIDVRTAPIIVENSRLKSLLQINDKDIINNFTEGSNGSYDINHLKKVIFGECFQASPKITYSDNLIINSSHYNTDQNLENPQNVQPKSPMREVLDRKLSRKKISTEDTDTVMKRFVDIKNTRELQYKMKKIQFALFNEIKTPSIQSALVELKEKLKISAPCLK